MAFRGDEPLRGIADPWCSRSRWRCSGVASPRRAAARARLVSQFQPKSLVTINVFLHSVWFWSPTGKAERPMQANSIRRGDGSTGGPQVVSIDECRSGPQAPIGNNLREFDE